MGPKGLSRVGTPIQVKGALARRVDQTPGLPANPWAGLGVQLACVQSSLGHAMVAITTIAVERTPWPAT